MYTRAFCFDWLREPPVCMFLTGTKKLCVGEEEEEEEEEEESLSRADAVN